jgi:hypothetical protein
MALTLCSLFSLLVVVIGTTGVAHAVAGAQSAASITVDPFNDPRTTVNRATTEAITTSASPNNFVINSTQRSVWEDVTVQSVINDSPYNNATATADSTGSTVSQLALALANGNGGYSANAQTVHDVDFQVILGGDILVSAVYDVLMQVYADYTNESASGYLLAGLYLRNLTQLTESSDVVEIMYSTVSVPEEYFASLQGALSTTLNFATGDFGSFRVIVDGGATADSVPEPSTLALLGFGLVGAALLRKRIRN